MKQTLERVVWSEGMLMAPQHFQRQDAFHEGSVDARLTWTVPHAWGVATLELDEAALEAGRVTLCAFSGVLPGGGVVQLGGRDAEGRPTRMVAEHFGPQQTRLDVFLALPAERSGASSFAQQHDGERARARYVIELREVQDAVTPGSATPVALARPNLMLLFGEEPRDDCESIKIAEVVRDASGALRYASTYVPPCLRLSASPWVLEGLRQVLAACVSKRRVAAAQLRHHERATDLGDAGLPRYLVLHVLSGAIPLLANLYASADVSTHAAYLTLVELAGQLSVFVADADPASLPAYVHTDLRATFEALFSALAQLLQVSVGGRALTVGLDARVDGMHLGRLHEPDLARAGARFFLSVRAALAAEAVQELAPRLAKLASWTDIPRYVNAAVAGVPLAPCTRPPRELPMRADRQYFAIDVESPIWRAAVAERTVAVHLPAPFEPAATTVELIAIVADS